MTEGYPGVSIENFDKSWRYANVNISFLSFLIKFRNGLAFCALVHRLHPDALDFASLKGDEDSIVSNNQLGMLVLIGKSHFSSFSFDVAFDMAFQYLKVPKLLDAEDMLMPKPEVNIRCSIFRFILLTPYRDSVL